MKPTPYSIADFDTSNPALAARRAGEVFSRAFPGEDTGFIAPWFSLVARLFRGEYPGYQAMDTVYHDLEHTLQATLCWTRLMCNRQRTGVNPQMSLRDFEAGLVAILMHDLGYLKDETDGIGTGAKYTFVHERRSCEIATLILEELGWARNRIFVVQHLILCTGPRAVIDSIPFVSEMERIMGLAVTTADYLGQMSDPAYPEKLAPLFREFEESDNYRGTPQEKRLFHSSEEMIGKTPGFWRHMVLPKLNNECMGLYHFLAEPWPNGRNPYIEAVEENIRRIEEGRILEVAAAV